MALEQELATYKVRLPDLLSQEGKFVLIHERDVVETFDTFEDAMKGGYSRFKLEPFMVKQIFATEPVYFIPRLVKPCHS
jgi:hypothetical protein